MKILKVSLILSLFLVSYPFSWSQDELVRFDTNLRDVIETKLNGVEVRNVPGSQINAGVEFWNVLSPEVDNLDKRITLNHKRLLIDSVEKYLESRIKKLSDFNGVLNQIDANIIATDLAKGLQYSLKREHLVPEGSNKIAIFNQCNALVDDAESIIRDLFPGLSDNFFNDVIHKILIRNVDRIDDPLAIHSKRILSDSELVAIRSGWDSSIRDFMKPSQIHSVNSEKKEMRKEMKAVVIASRMQKVWSRVFVNDFMKEMEE